MDLHNRRGLKDAAKASLSEAPNDPKKIILIHTGLSVALMLLLVVLDFVLSNQIENTGGLSGLGTRSLLTTVQSLLQLVQLVALPFWEIGYLFCAMKMARKEAAEPASLLEGFRRFGPFLRAMLLQGVIYFGIMVICIYIGTQIFMFTPFAEPMLESMMPLMSDAAALENTEVLNEAMVQAMEQSFLPLLAIIGGLFCIVAVPISYWFRMVNYALLDDPKKGAIAAMGRSRQLMRNHCFSLFQLDLSFWWYYLLQVLLNVVCYGDVLLSMAGVTLPWSGDVSFFLFYILFLVGQLVLYYFARNQVEVTYALAYDSLCPPRNPKPQNHLWNDQ